MSFFTRYFSKPRPVKPRRTLDVATMQSLLAARIKDKVQSNYRPVWTKERAACVTSSDLEDASKKSFAPWQKNVWECEDQARSLIETAQRKGANEGHTLAIGMVFGDPPGQFQDEARHVYVFGIYPDASVNFYDPTAQRFCGVPENLYFSLL
jgi:hypothetical protein